MGDFIADSGIAALLTGPSAASIPTATIAVVFVGMLALAAYDIWRREVEDWATATLALLAVIGLLVEGIDLHQWIGAVLTAAVAFLFYAGLGMRGVMGGGDVKLAAIPAFVLGAANPLFGLWWIVAAIVINQVFLVLVTGPTRRSSSSSAAVEAIPHVPAMAVSMLVTAMVYAIV